MLILYTQGRSCEIDLNMCRSGPCLNGATCSNSPNTFECTCAPGFTGPSVMTLMNVPLLPVSVETALWVTIRYMHTYPYPHPPTGHARRLQL